MTGRKRAADDTQHTTRASKAAKADTAATPVKSGRGGRKSAKTALAVSAFKSRALPLHANITHTPPAIESDELAAAAAPAVDTGAIGTVTLTPSSFSTGSYGWKGSKRVVVELLGGTDNAEEKEKVQVMLTINATVIGSKQAKGEDETVGENEVEPTVEFQVTDGEQKAKEDGDQQQAEDDKANGE